MKWKGLIVVGCILVSASVGRATIPTRCEGNIYAGESGGAHRFAWIKWQWPPPNPPLVFEFHHDRTSWRFTAADTATIAALQLYSTTPAAKLGQNSPQLTISIQTDDGSGKPSGTTIASHTETYPLDATNQYSGPITAPMTASLTAGTVYHIVTVCDSLTTYSWSPLGFGGGMDYANSAYDFRLDASDGATLLEDLNQRRTYDSTEDTNLLGLYYNHISGSPYENQWVEGTHEATDEHPDGNEEENAKKRPLFEMFATYDSQTQTASDPIPNLAQGYNTGYQQSVVRKNRRVQDSGDAVGEKFVAHYPTAVPVAKKVRMYVGKVGVPNGDLLIQVRDGTNAVVATGTVPEASVLPDSLGWVEADLSGDVSLEDGQTYYVVATTDATQVSGNYYGISAHQGDTEMFPSKYNSYMGVEAVLVEDYDTGGATWIETDTRDTTFLLAIIIPGDAQGDGYVNVGDLGILGANYGQCGKTWMEGDFNGDGCVNVGDLGILGAHYGEHLTPEPTTTALLVLGALTVLRRRRR